MLQRSHHALIVTGLWSSLVEQNKVTSQGRSISVQGYQFDGGWADLCPCWADKKQMRRKGGQKSLKCRLHGFVNSWYWPSRFYLIRFPFLRLDLLDTHCYASCAAACCHTADAMCFCIDYTSGISSNANARVCVCVCMDVCVLEEWVKEHIPIKPYPRVIVFTHVMNCFMFEQSILSNMM